MPPLFLHVKIVQWPEEKVCLSGCGGSVGGKGVGVRRTWGGDVGRLYQAEFMASTCLGRSAIEQLAPRG